MRTAIAFPPLRSFSLRVVSAIALAATITAVAPASSAAATAAGNAFDGAWTNVIAVGGTLPPSRRDMCFVYDPIADRAILLAGGSTWALNFTPSPSWTNLGISSPYEGDEMGVYDPVGRRIVVVNSSMQVFALSLTSPTSWAQITPLSTSPASRSFFSVAHDALRNRLLVYGGGPYTGLFNDVWALDLNGPPVWTLLTPSGPAPPPAWGPSAAYDAASDRLIVVGGSVDGQYSTTNDVWALPLAAPTAWTHLAPTGASPPRRMLASVVSDPAVHRLVLYGGYAPGELTDAWELDLSGDPVWTLLAPTGPAPPGRWSHGALYRSGVPQMVVFGGGTGQGANDTWALSFPPLSATPIVGGFTPAGGRVGDMVTITGANLATVTSVTFAGTPALIESAAYSRVTCRVPTGATTGRIAVTGPDGSAESPQDFFVGETPIVDSASPDSAHVGEVVLVHGSNFTGTTQVTIGGTGAPSFSVLNNGLIELTIDSLSTTGPIRVTTPAASGQSTFNFLILADDPRPHILLVRDVPGDQGGRVVVAWRSSDFDQARYRTIAGYRVWRRANVSVSGAVSSTARRWAPPDAHGNATALVFWESIADLPAAFLRGYAFSASTLSDSTESGNPYSAFFVQALTADRFLFYNSNIDSAYSVDNLSPPTPVPFMANYGSSSNSLHWAASRAPDLLEFRLYRSSAAAFVPSASTLIAATRDTALIDAPGDAFYLLVAVDIHGNLSHFATVSPDLPVATLASLVSIDALANQIRLAWYAPAGGGLTANLYRREAASGWASLGTITADGTGMLRYTDDTVTPGTRYGYRLGIMDGGAETFVGEAWASATQPQFALVGAHPNPSVGGRLAVEFVLPTSDPATLDLIDITGRRIANRDVGSMGPGRFTVDLAAQGSVAPGVYLVRLSQGKRVQTTRAVVLR